MYPCLPGPCVMSTQGGPLAPQDLRGGGHGVAVSASGTDAWGCGGGSCSRSIPIPYPSWYPSRTRGRTRGAGRGKRQRPGWALPAPVPGGMTGRSPELCPRPAGAGLARPGRRTVLLPTAWCPRGECFALSAHRHAAFPWLSCLSPGKGKQAPLGAVVGLGFFFFPSLSRPLG